MPKGTERGERAHIVPPLDAWTGGDRAPWCLMHRMLSILTLICPKCGHAYFAPTARSFGRANLTILEARESIENDR
jgi:hypothetical protein